MRILLRGFLILLAVGVAATAAYTLRPRSGLELHPEWRNPGKYPSDYFGAQRAFPGTGIPHERLTGASSPRKRRDSRGRAVLA